MKIQIVTPASRSSQKGNWTTAARWAKICRQLGHKTEVVQSIDEKPTDLLIALHARKSARAIQVASAKRLKSVLLLTGTDIYNRFTQKSTVWNSIKTADRLVVLQSEAMKVIPKQFQQKVDIIYQSAVASKRAIRRLKTVFEFCCIGHLRPVKDPFRAALATRTLPVESRIRVDHFGAALSDSMQDAALKHSADTSRYRWLGAYPRGEVLARIARCRAIIVTSKLEGGSGVITEAIAAGTPVLASRVSGNIGILGSDYAGFFDYRKTGQLAKLMRRCETDSKFYARLRQQIQKRKPIVAPKQEEKAIGRLIRSFQ